MELWCCHMKGPDEVYAAPDKATAERWADETNRMMQARYHVQLVKAEAAMWPWSAEDHAKNLPQAIADMTPRGE